MQSAADPRVESLANFAAGATRRALQGARSSESILKLLKKLHSASRPSESEEAPCRKCLDRRIASALISELIPIQKKIDAMSLPDRLRLAEAAERYRFDTFPFRDGRLGTASPTCPFLCDGKCLLGDAKPFSSFFGPEFADQGAALPYELGHAVGLCSEGLDHHRVELGLAVPKMVEDAGWVESYLGGGHLFWEEGHFPALRDPVIEQVRALTGAVSPSGAPSFDPLVAQAEEMESEVGVDVAQANLPRSTVLQRVVHLRIPNEVRSEDEIDLFRSRIFTGLRNFVRRAENPADVFDALRHFHLFPLAYHGREVKSILQEVGSSLFSPTVASALPDMVQPIEKRRHAGPLRVGYISSNLRMHNGGFWSLGWIQNHGEDIESFAFSLNAKADAAALLFRKAADHYFELPGDVPSTARFIKSMELDLLIYTDLGMDMVNNLYGAMRLAPVQATAWGHPVTSGLSSIDYYLSSDWMEPPAAEEHYTEKLVRLPESGLFFTETPESPSKLSRADFGIDGSFLALVPQNPIKLVPREDAIFAEISEKLGTPLVFVEGLVASANRVVRERLDRAGVRAHWVPFQTHQDFLRLIELADVVLDVPSWNGGNTTLHALSRRKPIVTLPGAFMRGRHSLAFLRQSEMESLIARDPAEFVRLSLDVGAQQRAAEQANFEGAFRCTKAVNGLDEWIRRTCKL